MPLKVEDDVLEAFGDEMIRLITTAAKQQVIVPVPSESAAITLRHRLYRLRNRCRMSKSPTLKFVLRTQFSIMCNGEVWVHTNKGRIIPPNAKWALRCQPADADVSTYITKALADVPDLTTLNSPLLGDQPAPDLTSLQTDTEVVNSYFPGKEPEEPSRSEE